MVGIEPTTHKFEETDVLDTREAADSSLESLARKSAKNHLILTTSTSKLTLNSRLKEIGELLENGYQFLKNSNEARLTASYAAEWMLDNYYIVQQMIQQISKDMPKNYYQQLPRIALPQGGIATRVYLVAKDFLNITQAQFDIDQLKNFVRAYQQITYLKIGELWALPTMLRFGILEGLAKAIIRITGLQPQNISRFSISEDTEGWQYEEISVAHSITSLRLISTQDWKSFFENTCIIDEILRKDPAGVYNKMNFDTRNLYRGCIEKMALSSNLNENHIAEHIIALAENPSDQKSSDNKDTRSTHVGYYLIDAGRDLLENRIKLRPSLINRLGRWAIKHPTLLYLGSIAALWLLIQSGVISYTMMKAEALYQIILAAVITILPASTISVSLCNWVLTHLIPPRPLPRMDFENGVPPEYQTIIVIPYLLGDGDEIKGLLEQIELHYLGNIDPHIHFAILTDFADAPEKHMPGDRALLDQVIEGIKQLNHRYSQPKEKRNQQTRDFIPFFLFHRERKWNPSENCWMGWERKRGKLFEFNRLLGGFTDGSFVVKHGDLGILSEIKYVITLDCDNSLPFDCARQLIATITHPLNKAHFDEMGSLIAGYTIIQPRVQTRPSCVNKSILTQVFSDNIGFDPYSLAVSDIYQDLFGDGLYIGKGIYDVVAFERSLKDRILDNSLLSHDLFEGIHGMVGLATDIILFEDLPSHYLAHAHRKHRWIRGDWQLLPWLLPTVPHATRGKIRNELSVINYWKIIDNLRRSLFSLSLLVMLVAGWLFLPSPLIWISMGILTLATPVLTNMLAGVARKDANKYFRSIEKPLITSIQRSFFSLTFLLYEAIIAFDAIVTTVIRLLITRKRLLQWQTCAHTVNLFGKEHKLGLLWYEMKYAIVAAFLLIFLTILIKPESLITASPLILLWIASPMLAYRISEPRKIKKSKPSEDQIRELHRLAIRSWLYFEQFVGPEDHWLPPDHYQETPRGLVAHRTSPTNIGLYMVSTLAAYDLGYLSTLDMSLRLDLTFESLYKLKRYRGHFVNWLDTTKLEPLPPSYISTVDSGNLAGCLLTLSEGIKEIPDRSALRWQYWQGFADILEVLNEIVTGIGPKGSTDQLRNLITDIMEQIHSTAGTSGNWIEFLNKLLTEDIVELSHLLMSLIETSSEDLDSTTLLDIRIWAERVQTHIDEAQRTVDQLYPWYTVMQQQPEIFVQGEINSTVIQRWQKLENSLMADVTLKELPQIYAEAINQIDELQTILTELSSSNQQNGGKHEYAGSLDQASFWFDELKELLNSSMFNVNAILVGLESIRQQAIWFFQEMDFSLVFNPDRKVFHIGFTLDTGRLDDNHYDLLASEARLASYLAIAKGEVPQSHWLYLARPFTSINGSNTLLSWSGTMFEYLMPSLFMDSFSGTVLDQSIRAVIKQQISYGRQHKIPWGISESGFFHFDSNQNYQYKAFGVPGLGLKRGLGDDLVVSPYASLLALEYDPIEVVNNIDKLKRLKTLGIYGFYEAIDFSPAHLNVGQTCEIVRSYMAHHQGMILLSLSNYLLDKSMVHRFHRNPLIKSFELLLYESIPSLVPVVHPHTDELTIVRPISPPEKLEPWTPLTDSPIPQAHFLSNGRFSTMITDSGSGFCEWQNIALTRWRTDATLDNKGVWIYIKDLGNNELWSATLQPTGASPENYEVRYYPHKAVFVRRDHDISVKMEITTPPNDDLEIRWITVSNQSHSPRKLSISSYGEVVLAPQVADRRHPAFNKLFIESEYIADAGLLIFHRRPRSEEDQTYHMGHMLVHENKAQYPIYYESDRGKFIWRGASPHSPSALMQQTLNQSSKSFLSGTTGNTLDPVMALGTEFYLPAHDSLQMAFITIAGESRQDVIEAAERYQSWTKVQRSFYLSKMASEQAFTQLELSTDKLEYIQQLVSLLVFPHRAIRSPSSTLRANTKGQSGLWRYAISGDYPILLVRIGQQEEINLIAELLQVHEYWRNQKLKFDLVILNLQDTSYDQDLHNLILRLTHKMGADLWFNRRGGIFLIRSDQMNDEDRTLLETVARVVLDGEKGSLSDQLENIFKAEVRLPQFVPIVFTPTVESAPSPLSRPKDLLFDNETGGFSKDGKEYIIYLEPDKWTPAPWINVIANPDFGFLISETGSGYSWAENSGENRLTSWHNDPIVDSSGEAIYLRDEESGEVWSPTPLPARAQSPYLIRHGAGYTIFENNSHGLNQRVRMFVVKDAAVKAVQVKIKNTSGRTRRISLYYYAEWVLGTDRDITQQHIIPAYDSNNQTLLAFNPYNEDFGSRMAFLTSTRIISGFTTDRVEFLGRLGNYKFPAALGRHGLTATIEPGRDPCAVLQNMIWLTPGESKEVTFLLGQGSNQQDALRLVKKFKDPLQIENAWAELTDYWDQVLSAITVQTPDPAMNTILNRWMLYQSLSCRVWGRSALYQSGGAYGFRDQLQDVMALVHAVPEITREHIIRSANHQFEDGDVLHWWHPPSGRGIRTRCSDDLLWLPYAVAHYVSITGDQTILDEQVSYLRGNPLEANEIERYGKYESSPSKGTIFEHCQQALKRGSTIGQHGLPLIGSHDWNDGMNRVGIEGKGESVWNGWFLYDNLNKFAKLSSQCGDVALAAMYRQQAAQLKKSIEDNTWDGKWYLRAFFDDGTPIGSARNQENQIDSIAQSWGVLSQGADPERANQAMEEVFNRLVCMDDEIILLFTPPFDKTKRDPGYIKGYPPGIRENGGQYTHAAIWVAWAYAQLGQGDRAESLFRLLNPIYHSNTPEKSATYRVEPFVIAADIYSIPPYTGRGGWTWYTGSAGWMYRFGIEAILGLKREGEQLRIDPCIPKHWTEYKMTYRYVETIYQIHIDNPRGVNKGVTRLILDGSEVIGDGIQLINDGQEHAIHVLMG